MQRPAKALRVVDAQLQFDDDVDLAFAIVEDNDEIGLIARRRELREADQGIPGSTCSHAIDR